jgi:hypothetical protein
MSLVFERDFDLGSVKLDLAVVDNHVLRHDFSYAQLAQMFSGLLDHVLGGIFPALGTGADEFDNVVSALRIDNLVGTPGHEPISFLNAVHYKSIGATPGVNEDAQAKDMSTFGSGEHLQDEGRHRRVVFDLRPGCYHIRDRPPMTRLTTTAAMPASTALASGDDSMSVIGLDPACS